MKVFDLINFYLLQHRYGKITIHTHFFFRYIGKHSRALYFKRIETYYHVNKKYIKLFKQVIKVQTFSPNKCKQRKLQKEENNIVI